MGLYKRGKKWYCSIVDAKGKLVRKALSADKRIAETILGEMRKRFELQRAGVLPIEEQEAHPEKDLREIMREFLDYAKLRGRSWHYFERFDLIWRHVVEANNIQKVADISLEVVRKWVIKKQAQGIKGQTINNGLSGLKTFTAWAEKSGYVTRDPLASWEALPTAEKKFRRDLTSPEVTGILAAEKEPEYKLRWMVYFFTGLRKTAGEALAWEWLDWDNRLIILPVEENKSRRTHRIPMHPELYLALKEWHNSHGSPKSGAVFPKLQRNYLLVRFKKVCQTVGIDLRGVCLHSVRHTVATRIYEAADKNLKAVQEVLGHSNVATTALYLHVDDKLKREAMESLRYA